jgi:hypothetical protein
MALVGILSTQLLIDQFVRNFAPRPAKREVELPAVPSQGVYAWRCDPQCPIITPLGAGP